MGVKKLRTEKMKVNVRKRDEIKAKKRESEKRR